MSRSDPAPISWHLNAETRYPHGTASPDAERFEPLGFPPPWPDRPWIYANVIASRNGIVAWKRSGKQDDPIRLIAGGTFARAGRRADLHLMRYLRAFADAFSVGAQTLRDQPDLIGAADDVAGGVGETMRRFRAEHGLPRFPLQVLYSASGRLDLGAPIFNTPDLKTIVVTTEAGARLLRPEDGDDTGVTLLVAGAQRIDSAGLVRAHEQLFEEFGVRYLVCEGGAVTLDSLCGAGILDEIFVTATDVEVDLAEHEGVLPLISVEAARLVAEGRTPADPGYVFRRWRFNER